MRLKTGSHTLLCLVIEVIFSLSSQINNQQSSHVKYMVSRWNNMVVTYYLHYQDWFPMMIYDVIIYYNLTCNYQEVLDTRLLFWYWWLSSIMCNKDICIEVIIGKVTKSQPRETLSDRVWKETFTAWSYLLEWSIEAMNGDIYISNFLN